MNRWTVLALLATCGAGILPAAAAAQQDTQRAVLTLEDVYGMARVRSPMLRAAGALADAAGAREAAAGLPPDPTIQLGLMNLSLPGLDADMPTSMAPAIQAMQMLPLFGKLGLSERIAEQSTTMARSGADEMWWDVRGRAAMAFYDIYRADRQLEVMRETRGLLEDFEQVAQAMYATGAGRQSDALRAGVEVARMTADITRMEAMRRVAAARLNGILDRPADTPVEPPALSPLPLELPGVDTLRAWAHASRPVLERGRTAVEQARTRGDLARREIWPDPVIGVQYGQRAGAMGTERMGSVMLGFSVPVFAGSRQLRMRDEAAAMEAMARAELDNLRAEVDADIAELVAELDRTRTLVELHRTEILPQARANVESAFSSYRVGRVDFMTLVDAQMTVNRYEQDIITLLADYGRFIARLEAVVGREMPLAGPVLAEDR